MNLYDRAPRHFFSRNVSVHAVAALAASLALATVAGPQASAATIINLDAAWPAAPAVQSVDALSVTNGARGISGTRVNRQSLTVTDTVTVAHIYLSAANYNDQPFVIRFFEVSDVNGNLDTGQGAQVGGDITVDPFGATGSGNRNLRISLSGAEQVTLPGVASPAGYNVVVTPADEANPSAFNWLHSNTGSNLYAGGRYRRDDGNQDSPRDYGVALVAVPEPSAVVLALAAALALRRRR